MSNKEVVIAPGGRGEMTVRVEGECIGRMFVRFSVDVPFTLDWSPIHDPERIAYDHHSLNDNLWRMVERLGESIDPLKLEIVELRTKLRGEKRHRKIWYETACKEAKRCNALQKQLGALNPLGAEAFESWVYEEEE